MTDLVLDLEDKVSVLKKEVLVHQKAIAELIDIVNGMNERLHILETEKE